MANYSDAQASFLGGEWSPLMAGRFDDPRYKTALTLSLNYLTGEEGSLFRRSGSRFNGPTRGALPGRLIDWKYTALAPYLSEFTDGYMRLWDARTRAPVISDNIGVSAISTDNPVKVTLDLGLGANWATGNTVYILPASDARAYCAAITNRQMVITIVVYDAWASGTTYSIGNKVTASDGHDYISIANSNLNHDPSTDAGVHWTSIGLTRSIVTLADAVTGDSVDGSAFTGSFTGATMQQVYESTTPYTSGAWSTLRRVQMADSEQNVYGTGAVILQRAVFLHKSFQPYSIRSDSGFTLQPELFKDGPYLDLPDVQPPVLPDAISGSVNLTVSIGWDTNATYSKGEIVTRTGAYYISVEDGNHANDPGSAGDPVHWAILLEWDSATTYGQGEMVFVGSTVYFSTKPSNLNHNPTAGVSWSTTAPTFLLNQSGPWASNNGTPYVATDVVTSGPPGDPWVQLDPQAALDSLSGAGHAFSFQASDVGRLIRLLDTQGAAPWNVATAYSTNDMVLYQGNVFKATASSAAGVQPDITPAIWSFVANGAMWTWGRITAISNDLTIATIDLLGNPLRTTDSIYQWRMGLYSDGTGWPDRGAYHEGRLWLASPVFPNRFDASVSNDPFNFAPTGPDGTVADDNAISEVLNAEDSEIIRWLRSTNDGMVMGTEAGEWLIQASNLADPITPTSIQARKATTFGSADVEPVRLPSALAVVQGLKRRVLEYKNWIDSSAYSVAKNGVNMLNTSGHLSVNGIAEMAFVSDPAPILYVRDDSGGMFAIAYKRDPQQQYIAPASMSYARNVTSIASQIGADGISANCWLVSWALDGESNQRYAVEMFSASPFDSPNPYDEWFLDSGIQPVGFTDATDHLSATLYGMWYLAGKTVTVSVGGADLGQWTVAANGTINIVYATAGVTEGTFEGAQPPPTVDQPTPPFMAVCGFTYTSRAQKLRPFEGAQNGPAFAKTKRQSRMGLMLYNTHEIKLGTEFSNLQALDLTTVTETTPIGLFELRSGVYRDSVRSEYDFDNMLCWEQTRPYPGVILAAGGFGSVTDV